MECYLEATIPVYVLYLTYPFICILSVERSNSKHCMHFVILKYILGEFSSLGVDLWIQLVLIFNLIHILPI